MTDKSVIVLQDELVNIIGPYVSLDIMREFLLKLNELDTAARREMVKYIRSTDDR